MGFDLKRPSIHGHPATDPLGINKYTLPGWELPWTQFFFHIGYTLHIEIRASCPCHEIALSIRSY